ncbi:MAG TPA: DUF2085 domain-containing protein [Chloroflexota bacterium]|nr:DUF2085 domain-containing protein [Chloroflexota bacterium]
MAPQKKTAVWLADWRGYFGRRSWLVVVVVGAVVVMAFYAVTDPTAVPHDHLLDGADWMGAALCHRITERSFTIYGRQFPLCARCTGMYLGVFLVFLTLLLAGRARWSELPRLPILLTLIGFIGIMGLDGVNSYTHFFPEFPHLYEPRNWLRLLTGMGAGLAMGLFLFPVLAQTLWAETRWQPTIGNFRELAGVVLVGGTAVLLLLSNQPAVLYVLALASVAGQLLVLMGINAVLLLVLLRRDGRARRWRDTAVPLTICLFIAIVQLGVLTFIRLQAFGTIAGFPGI